MRREQVRLIPLVGDDEHRRQQRNACAHRDFDVAAKQAAQLASVVEPGRAVLG